ncbi:M1 family metallopeptidase [Actinoplanes sp. NPDC026619]|uniref:M1 family metallopeptidase n=1 Tax=Actinoplanes sp. NPDC026619 TaxID=3155798 RepID=UPI0033C415CE
MRRTAMALVAVPVILSGPVPHAGAAGVGDTYYPDYGNGGYDVSHYDIRLRYQPATDELSGATTILARATEDLTSFDLDFVLDVQSVLVGDRPAGFARQGDHELVVTPARPLRRGEPMTVRVTYADTPSTRLGEGFTVWARTPDGAVAMGEPESAWWWFPSNDHPSDKALFDVAVAVPDGVEVISPYPFEAQGGLVTPPDAPPTALENQTRPTYGARYFQRGANPYVVVHENSHQWFGDAVSLRRWQDIWLNEGFAMYAEWLWSEHVGDGTAQEMFDSLYSAFGEDDELWTVPPGDPGVPVITPEVYLRGAMTVHQLRVAVGDAAFFRILRSWVAEHRYGNADTAQFIALAERISGRDLGALFQAWLYAPVKPVLDTPVAAPARTPRSLLPVLSAAGLQP